VASHRDVPPPASGVLTEKEVVCLADKLVRCDRRVGVEERFGKSWPLQPGRACLPGHSRAHEQRLALRDLVERLLWPEHRGDLDGVLP
jgi:hypothetical protein